MTTDYNIIMMTLLLIFNRTALSSLISARIITTQVGLTPAAHLFAVVSTQVGGEKTKKNKDKWYTATAIGRLFSPQFIDYS